MTHFQRIVNEFPESEYYPKSLFALYYINFSTGDTITADIYSKRILDELPSSEYADYLRKALDLPVDQGSVQAMLRQGELEWLITPTNALTHYRNVILTDSKSETAARAAYFLAYNYDYTFYEPDSALKYYSWLHENHENSEQALASKLRFELLQQILVVIEEDTLGN